MLKRKGKLLVAVLFAAMVLLTGQARLLLDKLTGGFRDDLREMIYLPRGDGLKILACGFDAPLADALFIKGLIYFAETFQADQERVNFVAAQRRNYTYDLFDVVTDLSPRFARAYQLGSLFLTSSESLKSNMDGIKLLEKGIDSFTAMDKAGRPAVPDVRWLFHTIIANTYETNILYRRRKEGDLQGAAEARMRAGEEFRLGAASPGAPSFVSAAATGYAASLSGQGSPEDSQRAVLSVWEELYNQAKQRGDKDLLPDLERHVGEVRQNLENIGVTRELEKILSQAGKQFLEKNKRPARDAREVASAGLIPGLPYLPLDTEDAPDSWLALPDGTFRSRKLADLVTENDMDLLQSAGIYYYRINNASPKSPQELIDGKFLDRIPEPPLKELGQEYYFNPDTGVFENRMPLGPEVAPAPAAAPEKNHEK